jgi:SsrA-binding protein
MGKKAKERNDEPVIENRKARHDYEILETLEVIAEGYIRASETPPALNLHSVTIEEYKYAAPHKASSHRIRVLLAHKREILKLAKEANVKGMTIVPLKMYFKDGYAKLLIGLGKGRSSHDKRDAIGKREAQRDMQRAMSRRAR